MNARKLVQNHVQGRTEEILCFRHERKLSCSFQGQQIWSLESYPIIWENADFPSFYNRSSLWLEFWLVLSIFRVCQIFEKLAKCAERHGIMLKHLYSSSLWSNKLSGYFFEQNNFSIFRVWRSLRNLRCCFKLGCVWISFCKSYGIMNFLHSVTVMLIVVATLVNAPSLTVTSIS